MKGFFVVLLALSTSLSVRARTRSRPEPPSTSSCEFSFLVMGDSRGTKSLEIPEMYKAALREANLLAPDFVFHTGDHIMGYTADTSELHMEWNAVMLTNSELKVPFYAVPGNHDIQNATDRGYFLKNFPRGLYYSFDHNRSHFVLLNSEDLDHPDSIAGSQLDWLKADLVRAKRADGIYLFLHKPLWAMKGKGTSRAWMGMVHPLLAKARVKGVFAGHWHQYQFEERDGIKYYVTGGAGAPLYRPEKTELGGFYHYLPIKVKSGAPQVAVVKIGSILPESATSAQDVERSKALSVGIIGNPFLRVPRGKGELTIPVRNILSVPIEGTVAWKLEKVKGDFAFEPKDAKFSLAPGDSTTLTFKAKVKELVYRYPAPTAVVTAWFATEGKKMIVEKEIRMVQGYDCLQAKKAFKIDGDLRDWSGIPRLVLDKPEHAVFNSPAAWKGPGDCSAKIALAWDEKNLYLSAEVTDDSVSGKVAKDKPFRGDGLLFMLEAGVGPERFLRDTTTESFVQLGFPSDPSLPAYFYNRLNNAKPGTGEGVESIAKRIPKQNLILFEAAIPWSVLAAKVPQPGEILVGNLAVSDNDGRGRKGWLEWNPGGLEQDDYSYFGEFRLK